MYNNFGAGLFYYARNQRAGHLGYFVDRKIFKNLPQRGTEFFTEGHRVSHRVTQSLRSVKLRGPRGEKNKINSVWMIKIASSLTPLNYCH